MTIFNLVYVETLKCVNLEKTYFLLHTLLKKKNPDYPALDSVLFSFYFQAEDSHKDYSYLILTAKVITNEIQLY